MIAVLLTVATLIVLPPVVALLTSERFELWLIGAALVVMTLVLPVFVFLAWMEALDG